MQLSWRFKFKCQKFENWCQIISYTPMQLFCKKKFRLKWRLNAFFLSVNRNHNNNNKIAIPQIAAQCFQFFGCGQSVLLQEKKLAHYPNLLCLTFLVIYLDIARDLFRHINEENQYVTGVYMYVY